MESATAETKDETVATEVTSAIKGDATDMVVEAKEVEAAEAGAETKATEVTSAMKGAATDMVVEATETETSKGHDGIRGENRFIQLPLSLLIKNFPQFLP